MYSDKISANILASLFLAKGITKVVACPGSRNIPLLGTLAQTDGISCYPVTDERSAAFYALGMALAAGEPVAVCVTSGSALLNTLPAVAEAYYRNVPLIIVSADRPKEWINRNEGQTMPQHGVCQGLFRQEVDVDEVEEKDKSAADYATLLINKALNACTAGEGGPVHVNMHFDEPLFAFNTGSLPQARNISRVIDNDICNDECQRVIDEFISSERKIIVIGQLPYRDGRIDDVLRQLQRYYIVMAENLSTGFCALPLDAVISAFGKYADSRPVDFVLSLGGNFVSKKIKSFLRSREVMNHCEVNKDGVAHDTFSCQTTVVRCSALSFLNELLVRTEHSEAGLGSDRMKEEWDIVAEKERITVDDFQPPFSQLFAVKALETSLEDMDYDFAVHYANSMEVRIGCLYSPNYIWCNRGINGIEGSLSTAAGFSVVYGGMVFCVTGDLSFFYDQNALWNSNLKGNLRVMLLNNSKGGIFSQLRGLDLPDRVMGFVEGRHEVNARGICEQNDVGYIAASNPEEFRAGMVHFLTEVTTRPMVFEVFTSADDDRMAFSELNNNINKNI